MTAPFDYADIHRDCFAFRPVGVYVKFNAIPLIEGSESLTNDACVMHEIILATASGRYEPERFDIVEPRDYASHLLASSLRHYWVVLGHDTRNPQRGFAGLRQLVEFRLADFQHCDGGMPCKAVGCL